jgi:hypothetical protein
VLIDFGSSVDVLWRQRLVLQLATESILASAPRGRRLECQKDASGGSLHGPVPATAPASTANGTATSGSDYTAASTTLSFPPGTTSQTFRVTVLGDSAPEPNETFVVNLTPRGH